MLCQRPNEKKVRSAVGILKSDMIAIVKTREILKYGSSLIIEWLCDFNV